jgi:nicotinamide mononucleotide transporter
MNFFDIQNIFFTLGGKDVSFLEFICVIAGLTCVVLAGRNNKFNFWIGYLYNILLFILFWQQHLYAAMLLQPVAFIINGFGHWRWTHPSRGEESADDKRALKVSILSASERVWYLVFVIIAGVLWGLVLSNLGTKWGPDTFSTDPNPFLDAFVLMLTFLAQFLSAQKKFECWFVWLVVNATNIILYISAGMVFMPIVSALYLVNGIWSLITWYRIYKRDNNLGNK